MNKLFLESVFMTTHLATQNIINQHINQINT